MVSETQRGPGRPRSESARQAILGAALELAAERGADGLTMEAIAKRAGASKETLYRWWRTKIDILLEAFAELGDDTITVRDTGSLSVDLRSFMRATARVLDPPTKRLLRTLAASAAADSEAADQVREQFLVHRRTALATLLGRAVERGELTAEQAVSTVDLIYGSLWYRLIFGIGPLERAWADAVTDMVIAAVRSGEE